MALADYYLCDECGSKCFYAADLDLDDSYCADIAALCSTCAETHAVIVVPKRTFSWALIQMKAGKKVRLGLMVFCIEDDKMMVARVPVRGSLEFHEMDSLTVRHIRATDWCLYEGEEA